MSLALMFAFLASAAAPAPAAVWEPAPGLVQVPLWPGAAPDLIAADAETFKSEGDVAGKPVGWITNVSTPTYTLYPAKAPASGAAVLVFPGGGFMGLAIDLEGTEVCDWLTAKGVACVVVKYRVPHSEDHYDPALHRRVEPKVQTAFQDAQRAIRLVRAHAAEWSVDPRKIGVLGFSAGGYLAAKTATEFREKSYRPVDAADELDARPDFSVPIYPGHLWRPPGESSALVLNPRIRVTREVPPTFLLMAEDDRVDHVEQALTYYRALQKAGVPVEMHLYAEGGHAFGLRPAKAPITRWPALVETWLATIGMAAAEANR